MIPLIVLMPMAVAGGGLFGLAQERIRRKRLDTTQLIPSGESSDLIDESDLEYQELPIAMARGDLVQINHSEKAARIALGMTAVGLYYPPLVLASLPVIGYSAYNWFRTRYQFEQTWYKSPLNILAILALGSSMLTGHWLMASLVLTVDLASRKWIAKWTEGYRFIDESEGENTGKEMVPSSTLKQRFRSLMRVVLQGKPRWEWFPALIARVSMGLFFAISGWNKLFTVAHWKGLLSGMIATGLPFPKFLSLFLASVEFYGGALLTIGFMSTFISIALAFAMIVAIVTVEIPFVIPPGLGPLDWLDWFLYLPQVLYVLIFFWLIVKGPGPYSVDAVIARKLGLDKDEDETSDTALITKEIADDPQTKSEADNKPASDGGTSWTPPMQPA